jgi:hypothetical protein
MATSVLANGKQCLVASAQPLAVLPSMRGQAHAAPPTPSRRSVHTGTTPRRTTPRHTASHSG